MKMRALRKSWQNLLRVVLKASSSGCLIAVASDLQRLFIYKGFVSWWRCDARFHSSILQLYGVAVGVENEA